MTKYQIVNIYKFQFKIKKENYTNINVMSIILVFLAFYIYTKILIFIITLVKKL